MLDATADSLPDWFSAYEAHELVSERNLDPYASITIAKRAHSGLVRARARLFIWERDAERGAKEKVREENADLPEIFWWAKGEAALEQDWTAGDFGTWIERKYEWQAFGVEFDRSGVEAMLRPPTAYLDADMISPADETVGPPSAPLPPNDQIAAKMIELSDMGIARDDAAKLIRQLAGFENVGNELARMAVRGNLKRGRPLKNRQEK